MTIVRIYYPNKLITTEQGYLIRTALAKGLQELDDEGLALRFSEARISNGSLNLSYVDQTTTVFT